MPPWSFLTDSTFSAVVLLNSLFLKEEEAHANALGIAVSQTGQEKSEISQKGRPGRSLWQETSLCFYHPIHTMLGGKWRKFGEGVCVLVYASSTENWKGVML